MFEAIYPSMTMAITISTAPTVSPKTTTLSLPLTPVLIHILSPNLNDYAYKDKHKHSLTREMGTVQHENETPVGLDTIENVLEVFPPRLSLSVQAPLLSMKSMVCNSSYMTHISTLRSGLPHEQRDLFFETVQRSMLQALITSLVLFGVYATVLLRMWLVCTKQDYCYTLQPPGDQHNYVLYILGIVMFGLSFFMLLQVFLVLAFALWLRLHVDSTLDNNNSPGYPQPKKQHIHLSQRLPLWLIVSLLIGHTLMLYWEGMTTTMRRGDKPFYLLDLSKSISYLLLVAIPYNYAKLLTLTPIPCTLMRVVIIYCGRPGFVNNQFIWFHPMLVAKVRPWAKWAPRVYLIVNHSLVNIITLISIVLVVVTVPYNALINRILLQFLNYLVAINLAIGSGLPILLYLIRDQLRKDDLAQSKWLIFLSIVSQITWSVSFFSIGYHNIVTVSIVKSFRILNALSMSCFLVYMIFKLNKTLHLNMFSNRETREVHKLLFTARERSSSTSNSARI